MSNVTVLQALVDEYVAADAAEKAAAEKAKKAFVASPPSRRPAGLPPRDRGPPTRLDHPARLKRAVALIEILPGLRRAEEEVEVEDDEDVEVVADSAFLLLRRHIEEDLPLEGRGTAVTIELYNAGTL